jgi:nickel-dependent lactate racemase
MIVPGVAGYEEIQANHALVLERTHGYRRHPDCEPGRLECNPVAEQIAEAADFRPPDLALCLVPDADGHMAWVGAGPWRVAFEAAVEVARSWFEVPHASHRLMVASAGGAPFDASLIQAHKALDAAASFLDDGGELLFVADLGDGAGSPDMEVFLADPRPEIILERLAARWVQYGHTTLRVVEKTARVRVHLHSALDPDLAARLGFHPVGRIEDVVEGWREERSGETVAVMAGAAVYPRSRSRP